MFSKSAWLYDAIYNKNVKDYAAEAARVRELIEAHGPSDGRRLLDVACGTGRHLKHLRAHFDVEGLDLDEGLLEIARKRLPDVPLHVGDMTDFDLGHRFEALICLFSSIGYVPSVETLYAAVACMARHLVDGGVLLVEPWFGPVQEFGPDWHAIYVDETNLKIARLGRVERDGRLSTIHFHYLVGTPDGAEHFTEAHEAYLFADDEYAGAFRAAELEVSRDAEGLTGRGLFIGVKRA
jgi:SAM-dependent methyltransferase